MIDDLAEIMADTPATLFYEDGGGFEALSDDQAFDLEVETEGPNEIEAAFYAWDPIIEAPTLQGWEMENETMISGQLEAADVPEDIIQLWDEMSWDDWMEVDAHVEVHYEES